MPAVNKPAERYHCVSVSLTTTVCVCFFPGLTCHQSASCVTYGCQKRDNSAPRLRPERVPQFRLEKKKMTMAEDYKKLRDWILENARLEAQSMPVAIQILRLMDRDGWEAYAREHTLSTWEEGVELVLSYLEAAINEPAAQVACPPAEGECLLSLSPPAEGECLLCLSPPAEGQCLLVLPPQPKWEEPEHPMPEVIKRPRVYQENMPHTRVYQENMPHTRVYQENMPHTRVYQENMPHTRVYQENMPHTRVYQENMLCTRVYQENMPHTRVYQENMPHTRVYQENMPHTRVYQENMPTPGLPGEHVVHQGDAKPNQGDRS
ncbi:UNVERIFIED_CONTAM: hypothetical protein FKN15_049019 [Acipenser sinensis]